MTLTRRTWLLVPVLAALAACSHTPSDATTDAVAAPLAPTTAPAAKPPKLVVFMVVDGLPIRQVLGYRDQLQPDGFRRFLDRGTWFANAYYGHGYTVTAAGHSVMLSGAYPQRSSIIGNEWRHPVTGDEVYNTEDSRYQYIGHKTEPHAGTSPENYKVETVGDVLRTVQPGSKMIGISGKDRGAILPSGHKGTAYMYMGSTGQFASTTYYMQKHPAWVESFNAAKPADQFFGKAWTPMLPESAYARSVPDGQPWQANSGNGNRLPAVLGANMDGPGPRFYGNILPSPFGDELTLAFARAAVEGEQLGADDQTDILSVSLSSHDYVNHAFGPESRLSHDHFLHLDRHLQSWFQYLDQRIGRGNYIAVLTADHGFMDTPEWARGQGRDAGRINPAQVVGYVNAGLSKQYGEGRWVRGFSATGLQFDEALIQTKGLRNDDVYAKAKALAEEIPGVQVAFTRAQLAGNDTTTPFLEQMRKSWHPDVAAPLQLVPKPGWMFGSRLMGTTHGSPHEYDTHVPLLTWGPAWVGQGEVAQRVEVADLAPTLARILGIPAPRQAQGKLLPLPASGVAAEKKAH
ncbi:alkaline phosphatase family protein [Roseateles amylovorans]|uniref:Alkaline phosphatase family protein n=1 Tax=Roseateles amylovorans TaxID=2978473 RepID=A0ABY6B3E9_9BURK|nr:alkaline phosphatase family protein [Roseateles amylovorans]UXH78756.1 alkaline phosphatase family protein [Roseateles amylovorans]